MRGMQMRRKKMDKEYAIETLNRRLKEVVDKFNILKESGLNEEILKIYLQNKTKLSKKDIDNVIKNVEEFYDKLMKKELVKNLQK